MSRQLKELRLPDFFTLCGLASVSASVIFSMNKEFLIAYFLLILQFAFDGIDGKVARKYNSGNLGVYLDSFSDYSAITAVLFFGWFIGIDTKWIYLGGYVFLVAAAIRLSYFTVRSHQGMKSSYVGMPTVLAVVIIATIIIVNAHFRFLEMNYLVILYFIFSYMMVSNLEFKKLKLKKFKRRKKD